MSGIRVASMFAGIGGICLGFKQSGAEIIWANECDSAACRTYRHNFGNSYLVGDDVRAVNFRLVPDFDVLTAGFPCQPFSIAGKQKGFSDPRGNLFFEIARMIDQKRPKAIFLENVPNLVEHDSGKTFLVIYTTLAQFGYYVKYAVLGADEYGNLPQTRKRIYIAAFLDLEACNRFHFPDPIPLTKSIDNIIAVRERKHEIYYYPQTSGIYQRYSGKIKADGHIYRLTDHGVVRVKNQMCPTLTANMGTYPNRVPLIVDSFGLRKLTLRECLDFQGFPSSFAFPRSITINDAYKQIGNSVCVPVIKRIAEAIIKALTETG